MKEKIVKNIKESGRNQESGTRKAETGKQRQESRDRKAKTGKQRQESRARKAGLETNSGKLRTKVNICKVNKRKEEIEKRNLEGNPSEKPI